MLVIIMFSEQKTYFVIRGNWLKAGLIGSPDSEVITVKISNTARIRQMRLRYDDSLWYMFRGLNVAA